MIETAIQPAPSLRERKRELVRRELSDAAWALFAVQGYEDTTVAEIAEAAGVSRRTFFRYFAAKDDVLTATSDEVADAMLDAVAERSDEPPLVTIREALVPVLEQNLVTAPERSRTIIRLLRESPSLRRAMLDRHARMEERLAAHFAARFGTDAATDSRPALVAFVARAMMDTAFNVWYDQGRTDVRALVDELFAGLVDLTGQLGGAER